jgi:hypothetical protein
MERQEGEIEDEIRREVAEIKRWEEKINERISEIKELTA